MHRVVSDTTPASKAFRGIFNNTVSFPTGQSAAMGNATTHRPTYIRQWRLHRGYSLDKLSEMVPMDKSNLSKVERGILPYNQDMLERLAEALMVDPASLIMRDPSQPGAIWSLWERASPGERNQIETIAEALISARKRA